MTVTSYTLDLVESYARPLASLGIDVMVGGPHASFEPRDVMEKCPSVTYVVRGEAEVIFPEIVQRARTGLSLHGLPGVHTRGLTIDPSMDQVLRVADLGLQPMPRFDGLPLHAWWCPDAKRRPMVTLATTRGCPHECAFCSSHRAVGLALLLAGMDPRDPVLAERVARELDTSVLDDPRLRNEEVAHAGSLAVAHPGVRAALIDLQRSWCEQVPVGFAGVVLDGRDIGSTICPPAQVKLYLTADLQVRAERRALQLGPDVAVGEVMEQLRLRDLRDSQQPGVQRPGAPGVLEVDTTRLGEPEVLRLVLELVRRRSPEVSCSSG
jgi:cytidylate kinase